MLTVHHLTNSRSQRILWLLEELDMDYEVVVHPRDPQTQRSPDSLREIHPLGKGPVIDHDGQVIGETNAIIEYITRKLAGGRLAVGPDSPEYAAYLEWLELPEGSMMGPLVFDLIYQWTGGGNDTLFGFYDAEIERHQQFLEGYLAERDYLLASGMTAADINLAWTLEFAECRHRMNGYPALGAYLDRMRSRPAYARAIERGGPQDLSVFS